MEHDLYLEFYTERALEPTDFTKVDVLWLESYQVWHSHIRSNFETAGNSTPRNRIYPLSRTPNYGTRVTITQPVGSRGHKIFTGHHWMKYALSTARPRNTSPKIEILLLILPMRARDLGSFSAIGVVLNIRCTKDSIPPIKHTTPKPTPCISPYLRLLLGTLQTDEAY